DFRPSAWARLIVANDAAGVGPLIAIIAHPVTSAERRNSVRLETAFVADAHAIPVSRAAVWITGERIPSSAWIALRARGAAPVFPPLEKTALPPRAFPLCTPPAPPRALDGIVRSSEGVAAGAVVTLFRLIDPPSTRADDQQARRVFAAETSTDASG